MHEKIAKDFLDVQPSLNERSICLWCAREAKKIGYDGVSLVQKATGVSRPTIIKGIKELKNASHFKQDQIRYKGGGRKKITEKDQVLLHDLNQLIKPVSNSTKGLLRWTLKTTRDLKSAIDRQFEFINKIRMEKIERWRESLGIQLAKAGLTEVGTILLGRAFEM